MKLMVTPIRHIPLFPEWCTYSVENFLYINSFTYDTLNDKAKMAEPFFSIYGVNGNDWYMSFMTHTVSLFQKRPSLKVVQVDRLIEDEVLELKLKYGSLLIVSHLNGNLFTQYNNIVCTNYITYHSELKAVNLLTNQKFNCVIFNGSFEKAIINFVQNNSLLRYEKIKNVFSKSRRVCNS